MITIRLLDSVSEVETKVNAALVPLLNAKLKSKAARIESRAKELASMWIMEQPEVRSLTSNDPNSLAGLFGLTNKSTRVQYITQAIVDSVHVVLQPLDAKFKGFLQINFQPKDFLNVLTRPSGYVVYEKGTLPWIDWLLNRGSSIIISNYYYEGSVGKGRSGLGTMKIGGSFRVPPEFAGTENDNFITRAFLGTDKESKIAKIIEEELKS